MKKTFVKTAATCGLCLTLLASGVSAGAAYNVGVQNRMGGNAPFGQQAAMFGGMQQSGGFGQTQSNVTYASSASEVVTGTTTNSAASLAADYSSATTYDVGETGSVKISEAGTYIITGTCADGSITVKKGVTGVVLVRKDLDLTSTEGAALSINQSSEVKVIISGSVTLTDNENPDDENSSDADVADAYDGAAIKVKAGASAYITGTGTLTLNGNAKNGIKAGDETTLVIDGPTVNITAANDAINGSYDVALLSGKLTISAGDDAIHADRILTIGEDGNGPTITVKSCNEGIEATVVNLAGGAISVTSTDDGVNAANSDGTYASLGYSINVTGANVTVSAPRADGFDSNGNINLISGSATISSANNGGDAGLDYDGQLYVSDEFELNNYSGVTSMGAMGGMTGGMPGQQAQGQMNQNAGQNRQSTAPAQNAGQAPAQDQQNTAPAQNAGQAPAQGRQNTDQTQPFGQMGRGNAQAPMQGQQNQFGAPNQGMRQTPMQNGGMNNAQNAGGMWINGRWVPFWMLQQMMR